MLQNIEMTDLYAKEKNVPAKKIQDARKSLYSLAHSIVVYEIFQPI